MSMLASVQKFTASALPFARTSVMVLLFAVIGWLLAKAFWLIVEPGGAVSRTIPMQRPSLAVDSGKKNITTDITILARESRFGDGGAVVEIVPNAPETTLNLRLKGVRSVSVEDGNDDAAIAIILTPDNQSRTYSIGDTIIDGVTLQKVFPDRILLNRRGERETLMMESNSTSLAVLSRSNEEGLIEGRPSQGGANVTPPSSSVSPQPSASVATLNQSLAQQLKFEAVIEDGEMLGYRVNTSANPSGFAAVGLQQEDMIVNVNGQSVADADIQSLVTQISRPGTLRLTIVRNGAAQNLSLNLTEED